MPQNSAQTLFDRNMRSAHTCLDLFDHLPPPTPTLNTRWILRAAVVFVVSALDTYFHDKVKYRVGHYRLGALPSQLAKFEIPLCELETWQYAHRKGNVLRNWVTSHFSTIPLQSPEAIASALKLIGITDFWATIAGSPSRASALKNYLNAMVRRRNQIAHEGDRQQSRRSGKKLRPIGRLTKVKYIDFVEKLVARIEAKFPK